MNKIKLNLILTILTMIGMNIAHAYPNPTVTRNSVSQLLQNGNFSPNILSTSQGLDGSGQSRFATFFNIGRIQINGVDYRVD
ncbi:MAG: hypothetical protein HRT87_05940, partial [Legionellales bacterium]|nr:hypothetical protein [Legionellales bacterium]